MKKVFGFILGTVVLILALFWIFKGPVASYYLSKRLKVSVSIGSIGFSKNQIEIYDFEINNPMKYQERDAFKTNKIVIKYQSDQLPNRIESVEFGDSYMNISCDNPLCSQNNWTTIADGIEKKEQGQKEQNVVIKRMYFDNLIIDAEDMLLFPGKKDRLEIKELELKNISSRKGFPTEQIIAALFRSAGLKDLLKDVFQAPAMFDNIMKSLQEDTYN